MKFKFRLPQHKNNMNISILYISELEKYKQSKVCKTQVLTITKYDDIITDVFSTAATHWILKIQ